MKSFKSLLFFQGSESPEEHFFYVWDKFISKAAAQTIVVVAHSYGGIVIVEGVSILILSFVIASFTKPFDSP